MTSKKVVNQEAVPIPDKETEQESFRSTPKAAEEQQQQQQHNKKQPQQLQDNQHEVQNQVDNEETCSHATGDEMPPLEKK